MLESADSARSTRSLPAGQGVKCGRHRKSNASCKNVMLDPKIFRQKMKKTLHIKKSLYLCNPKTEVKTIEKSLQASDFQGEMPEWSIGAVSKTVDQLAGPRVRIPVSPLPKDSRVLNRLMGLFFMSKR